MIAYFAVGAASVAVRLLAGRNYLVSYAYIGSNFCSASDAEALRRGCARGFLDSGAFTAWKQGKPVDLNAYIEYVRRFGTDYTSIAALDDITSSETSIINWRRMLAELPGLATRIIPVWHEGEPIEVLDEYVAGSPIVGVGRTAGRRSKDKTLVLYDEVFNRWPAGAFHAFGNGDPVTLEPYPFHSFDCSTWERDSTYANKHGWPWGRVSKETRMRAYIEATETMAHTPVTQQTLRFQQSAGFDVAEVSQ